MMKTQPIQQFFTAKMFAVIIIVGLLFITLPSFTQSDDPLLDDDLDLPCGGTDPYATCPLDTGTFLLVIAGLSFGAYAAYQNNKMHGNGD